MSSIVEQLAKKGLVRPPDFVVSNTMYETVMGSVAYGVSDETSDFDTLGFCIPPKDTLFPHLAGEIHGFGRQKQRFMGYQQHHVKDGDREYDLNIYNIASYFHLCMECNPNMIDSLFTPVDCVLHCTKIGNMVRDRRRIFLHKGAWHKFKGYAYSQLHEMDSKNPEPGSKRDAIRKKYGYDVKFAYHVVRLIGEVEQILVEGDIDLRRNREHLKAIRRGEVPVEAIRSYFSDKEKALETLYHESKLPYSPDERVIRQLLLDCLEEHYGDLSSAVVNPDAMSAAFSEIAAIVRKYERLAA
jgi:predicted nucleotidyltransferase